jgi:hypothetical protein
MGFPQFVDVYMEDMKPRLKLNTFLTKQHIMETKIIPYFKNKSLAEITATDALFCPLGPFWRAAQPGTTERLQKGGSMSVGAVCTQSPYGYDMAMSAPKRNTQAFSETIGAVLGNEVTDEDARLSLITEAMSKVNREESSVVRAISRFHEFQMIGSIEAGISFFRENKTKDDLVLMGNTWDR